MSEREFERVPLSSEAAARLTEAGERFAAEGADRLRRLEAGRCPMCGEAREEEYRPCCSAGCWSDWVE